MAVKENLLGLRKLKAHYPEKIMMLNRRGGPFKKYVFTGFLRH